MSVIHVSQISVTPTLRRTPLQEVLDDVRSDQGRWAAHRYSRQSAHLPQLHLDDVSDIPFTRDVVGLELYQLRARVRAKTGDLYAATCPHEAEYEQYNRQNLELGEPTFVQAQPGEKRSDQVAEACRQGDAFRQICATARQRGGLVIHPYMGTTSVWELAEDIQRATHVPISVLAPMPAVARLANNKFHLAELVIDKLDPGWVVPSSSGTDAETLTASLINLAQVHPRVALKMPECASAMGIQVFESLSLLNADREVTLARVKQFLQDKQWVPGSSVQTVAWLRASHSPSSQLWIPPANEGQVVVEGIYEQLLREPDKVFLGSIAAQLPDDQRKQISRISIAVGTQLMALGYVGRCSFDFIVVDERVYLIECNGRWGGTSTPMHLVDRLFPEGRPPYVARDCCDARLVGQSFADLARRFGPELLDKRTGKGNFVFYNTGCLTGYGKLTVIALGETQAGAQYLMDVRFQELLARS